MSWVITKQEKNVHNVWKNVWWTGSIWSFEKCDAIKYDSCSDAVDARKTIDKNGVCVVTMLND